MLIKKFIMKKLLKNLIMLIGLLKNILKLHQELLKKKLENLDTLNVKLNKL